MAHADGPAAHALYVTRYLRVLRLDYPAVYDELVRDPANIRILLSLWGRANRWVETPKDAGVELDTRILELWHGPEMLAEIQRLRDMGGC